MRKFLKIQLIIFLFLPSFAVPGVAAAAPLIGGDKSDVIWKSGLNLYFKYTEQRDKAFGNNDHPVELSEEEISTALEALRIKDENLLGKEIIKPVFSPQQEKLMGKSLSRGLANARPDQDIVFVMQKSYKHLIFLDETAMVAGRAFYKDGKLNIIIGSYNVVRNEAFESVYDPSDSGNVPYNLNHGSRSGNSGFQEEIQNAPGIANKVAKNELRRDWFVIDVKQAAQAVLAKKNQREPGSQGINDRAMRLEAARLAKERRELRMEMARMRKEMQESSGGSKSDLSIEERLARLDELREKELISAEEYEQKRNEILNDI